MLEKLIKYDIKYGIKIFTLLHVMALISCVVIRFFFINPIDFSTLTDAIILKLVFLVVFLSILFSAVSFGTTAIYTVRFYKNLFSNEGYITWTLPVSSAQHFWAKILSATIWYVLDNVIILFCSWILLSGNNVLAAYEKISPELESTLGMPISHLFWICILTSFFGLLATISIFYTSVAIGQLFPEHRILCSVITCFVIYMVIQILCVIISFKHNMLLTVNASITTKEYLLRTLPEISIFTLIFSCIGLFITYHIMDKKLNLV